MKMKERFANLLVYLGLLILTIVFVYTIVKVLGWIVLGCAIIGVLLMLLGVSLYDDFEE